MNCRVLGTSVAALLVSCPAARPSVTTSPVSTRLACAERIGTMLGFREPRLPGASSVLLSRHRSEGGHDAWVALFVTASDSTVSVDVRPGPSGNLASEDAQLAADRIRRECGR